VRAAVLLPAASGLLALATPLAQSKSWFFRNFRVVGQRE
jgi:hypothetical protein